MEIECPVCDHRMPADARKCPSCGVELETAGMAELEEVARDILEGKPEIVQEVETSTPQSIHAVHSSDDSSPSLVSRESTREAAEAIVEPAAATREPADEIGDAVKDKGGFRRLFGRKKR